MRGSLQPRFVSMYITPVKMQQNAIKAPKVTVT
eukprot:CAMPEP_0182535154 /NCGR_PEP_ID=MMETSP1323-20130603/17180_1 /TAXON_ID=236787 /ORGANISM="Florenciella parvula, Strain RCC1693" /LENGTH=32 /DNA_ID= /DNA_START= /DNA_END= /DNA_ORIENTATION=